VVPQLARVTRVVAMVYYGNHPPPHVHVRADRPGRARVAEELETPGLAPLRDPAVFEQVSVDDELGTIATA